MYIIKTRMLNTQRIWISLALVILSLWSLMQVARYLDPQIDAAELAIAGHSYRPIQLPFQQDVLGDYRIKVLLNPGSYSTYPIQVIPDDELLALRVNGEDVSLAAFEQAELRDYTHGIKLWLTNLLRNQDNLLEFTLSNQSNPAGFSLTLLPPLNPIALAGIVGALLILVFALSRHFQLTRVQYVLLLAGIAAVLFYLSKTDSYTRTFDVYEGGGHRDYIDYLITHRTTPPPGEGWEYHQPPLYYVIAAVSKAVFAKPVLATDFWGQLVALWFWCIFLIASLATLRRAFPNQGSALFFASLALCLWPSGIIHSVRLGNDVPLYAFYALAFYYCVGWWKSGRRQELFLAALWACMALLTKSNALAIWGVIGALFLVKSYRALTGSCKNNAHTKKALINFLMLAGLFFVTLVLNFSDNLWHYFNGTSEDWLLSNVSQSINPALQVANTPASYLIFDVATFIQQPFISTWDDAFGRQYFWNFVWRSALSSEFFFKGTAMEFWGLANGIFLLLMLAGTVVFWLQRQVLLTSHQRRIACYRHLPWLLALVMPFILLIAYRVKVPLSCNTDFRYIYPVLLPLLYFSLKPWQDKSCLKLARALAIGAPLIGVLSGLWLVNLG